jgi:hypothetical protein
MARKRSRTKKSDGKHGLPARSPNDPSTEEIERHLREALIVRAEPLLVGTAYWGRAEAESARAISAEKDPKRREEMIKRYEELAGQLNDLSSREREQILLKEIAKWRKEAEG